MVPLLVPLYYKRHLPHWQPPDRDLFLTWRLHGSLPPQRKKTEKTGEAFLIYDRILDEASNSPHWLVDPRVAETILSAFQASEERQLLDVKAYAIMVNHVHLLLTPRSSLSEITRQIKGTTARQANLILSRSGAPFWQDESFDHWIRTPAEWQKIRTYIEQNPVAAGLVKKAEDWPWSSATRRTGFSLSGLHASPPKL
jgi:putative transposase